MLFDFPAEIITNIAFFLLPSDLYNLSLSNSYFSYCLKQDWDKYFRYHSDYTGNLDINKNFMVNYGVYLLSKHNVENIMMIEKIIDRYKDNDLYNKLIQQHKPVFLMKSNFTDRYYDTFFNYLGKIVIVEIIDFYSGKENDFDERMAFKLESLAFFLKHQNEILIIY